jgi:hypothetical protein
MTDRPAARLSTFEMVCHIVASGRTVRYIRPVCHGIDTRANRVEAPISEQIVPTISLTTKDDYAGPQTPVMNCPVDGVIRP